MIKTRCAWAEQNEIFHEYHDQEWGVPVHDDAKHFEFLILESAQAGLSWATILKRRAGYKKAFANFNPSEVAKFTDSDFELLIKNPEIIRNKLKVRSAINNAKIFLKIQDKFTTFDAYVWSFVGGKPLVNHWKDMSQVPAVSPESEALSEDLKKRGFAFVGPTIVYAYMQAVGMVNDHLVSCFRHE
jgi:DNA-3-methyladenine glycosylase I